jgi:tetrahydromethanopterin S-methyltransferase subunit G
MEIRMAHLEGAYEQINERLRSIDERMDARFDAVDRRFDAVDKKLSSGLSTVFVAVIGSNATILAAIIGAILTIHH